MGVKWKNVPEFGRLHMRFWKIVGVSRVLTLEYCGSLEGCGSLEYYGRPRPFFEFHKFFVYTARMVVVTRCLTLVPTLGSVRG